MRKVLLLLTLVFVATAFDCGKSNPRPTGQGQAYYVATGQGFTDSVANIHTTLSASIGVPEERSDFRFNGTTPMGARYFSTVAVPQEFLTAIDEGIAAQIARYDSVFTNPHWANYDQVADYDVLIITGEVLNVETSPGSPAMYVKGVQTAGTNIGNSGIPKVKKPYIVLPQQEFVLKTIAPTPTDAARFERIDVANKWGHLDYWRNSIENESEHVRESVNNRDYFERFAITGDAHPHQIP